MTKLGSEPRTFGLVCQCSAPDQIDHTAGWTCNSHKLPMVQPVPSLYSRYLKALYFYSCVFGKRNNRVLVRVCVCVCVCFRVCVCVCFLHANWKRYRSRNTKLEYIIVYENSSDEFNIELCRFKVKVIVGVQIFSPFITIQTVGSYSSSLVQARNLILSMYVHLCTNIQNL